MKFLVVFSVALACVAADVSHLDSQAPILKSQYDITPEGAFQYAYETGNGIYAQAEGVVKNPNNEYPSLEIKGAAKYNAPDGTPVELSYIANENGYQPIGSFIPATPDYVIRSLAYIEAHPPQDKPQASGYKPQASGYKPQSASPFQG